jgi:hypothetical protein
MMMRSVFSNSETSINLYFTAEKINFEFFTPRGDVEERPSEHL